MIRYLAVAVLLVALGYGARRLNRRITPARPTPLTLAERYDAEMLWGDLDDGPAVYDQGPDDAA